MNQDLNNLNQNDFNAQDNNDISNNQSLNNNVDKLSITDEYQNQSFQQPIFQNTQQNYNNGNLENKSKKKKTAVIVIIVLAVLAIIGFIIIAALAFGFFIFFDSKKERNESKIFNGNGYELTYDSNWKIKTISGKEALSYKNEISYFLPIGTSALDETINCNFDLDSCKTNTYNSFYNFWSSEMDSLKLYKNNSLFKNLNNDIYYATYDYGLSKTKLKGKYYLLISKEKNVVLSFMTNTSLNLEQLNDDTMDLLRTIDIDEIETKNNIYDDELSNTLNSMSNWNRYSNLRSGKISYNKSINGSWRILSDSETYWVFKNGQFWWYKSFNNLNDNYWYGTTKIIPGKSGLKLVGIDENKIDSIISKSNGKITENDIYTIIMTPQKIIADGVDKSNTNISENSIWNYIWIIIDHGSEGIEAQILDVDNNISKFYVKIED